jgi:pSer/pThr/pTyr-binding forkhead associated (FHA) protein
MAIGKDVRGPLWVDGQLTVRVRGPGPEPGRVVHVRRPFALIGQIPGADIRIDDPAVDGRHALLILDRRGVFGVDLLTGTGTRFAGSADASAWLGPGDILEIAGRRVELLRLRVDGAPVDPPLSTDDPLAVADPSGLVGLTLEPLDSPGPPWMLGSALAFVGRGEACAIRVENASASRTHCALLRGPSAAYAIDLLGRRTLLNGRPIGGASALLDGDVLTLGRARFAVRVDGPRPPDAPGGPAEAAPGPREAMLALVPGAAGSGRAPTSLEVLDALRQFRADASTLLEGQIGRIEALDREIASLREEIRGHRGPPGPPPPPLRLDLSTPTGPSEGSASWLLDRLDAVEAEGRSTWKDLLGRITSAGAPPARPGATSDDRS